LEICREFGIRAKNVVLVDDSPVERAAAKAAIPESRAAFLASLNCTVAFLPIPDSNQREFSRVLELVNKTNQFNTTGKRWTTMEVQQFFAAGGRIAAFRVKDRFADYGLIGTVFATGSEIIQFVMICRVLGMEIEQFVPARLVAQIRSEFLTETIIALFRETADNTVCRDIFPQGRVQPHPAR
jgi:FkbH-like protein